MNTPSFISVFDLFVDSFFTAFPLTFLIPIIWRRMKVSPLKWPYVELIFSVTCISIVFSRTWRTEFETQDIAEQRHRTFQTSRYVAWRFISQRHKLLYLGLNLRTLTYGSSILSSKVREMNFAKFWPASWKIERQPLIEHHL